MAQHSDKAALRGEPGYVWRSGQDRRLQMIRQWVDVRGRILDNGTGLGTYLEQLAPYSNQRFGLEVEFERAVQAIPRSDGITQAVGETLPFADNTFDFILSNEVIEHVENDLLTMREMVRVLKQYGRIVIFCPNRWNPTEQHGIYWKGEYHFGDKLFVNYLPDSLRDQLAPHVRTYTKRQLTNLTFGLPVRIVHHGRIYRGWDNIEARFGGVGRLFKQTLYALERPPFDTLGISHFLVLEKTAH